MANVNVPRKTVIYRAALPLKPTVTEDYWAYPEPRGKPVRHILACELPGS